MTTRETLRGPPFPCPDCGDEYHRLGRHWTSGACDPVLAGNIRQIVEGLALAGVSVDRGAVRVQSRHRALIEWTADQLDWLATTFTRVTTDETTVYELASPRHHALERYESWSSDGPPADYRPTALTARVWWAYAGGLQWHGPYDSQRVATISARADDRAAWIRRVLAGCDIETTRVQQRVQWTGPAVGAWLDWIGDPVPGVAYKWADSFITYRALRERPMTDSEYQVAVARAALKIARERTDQALTAETFDARVAVIDAATVADVLGGGDWNDALRVAGVDGTETETTAERNT